MAKTGADAVSKLVSHVCRIITTFGPKLDALITALDVDGVITSDQAALARTLLTAAQASCGVWQIIADHNDA